MIEKGQTSSDNEKAESLMVLLKDKIDDVAVTGEQKTVSFELAGDLVLDDDNSLSYSVVTRGLNIATTAWVPLVGGTTPVQEDMAAVKADGGSGTVSINDDVSCMMNSSCSPAQVVLSTCTESSIEATYSEGQRFTLDGDTYLVHHIDCTPTEDIDGQALILGPERERAGIMGADEAGVIIARSESAGDRFKTTYRLVYRELDDISSPGNDGYRIQLTRDGNNVLGPGQHRINIRRDDNPKISGERSKYGGDLIETKVFISMS
ncbi:MAG: hypothetical protein ABIG84_00085 [archaeon]